MPPAPLGGSDGYLDHMFREGPGICRFPSSCSLSLNVALKSSACLAWSRGVGLRLVETPHLVLAADGAERCWERAPGVPRTRDLSGWACHSGVAGRGQEAGNI